MPASDVVSAAVIAGPSPPLIAHLNRLACRGVSSVGANGVSTTGFRTHVHASAKAGVHTRTRRSPVDSESALEPDKRADASTHADIGAVVSGGVAERRGIVVRVRIEVQVRRVEPCPARERMPIPDRITRQPTDRGSACRRGSSRGRVQTRGGRSTRRSPGHCPVRCLRGSWSAFRTGRTRTARGPRRRRTPASRP